MPSSDHVESKNDNCDGVKEIRKSSQKKKKMVIEPRDRDRDHSDDHSGKAVVNDRWCDNSTATGNLITRQKKKTKPTEKKEKRSVHTGGYQPPQCYQSMKQTTSGAAEDVDVISACSTMNNVKQTRSSNSTATGYFITRSKRTEKNGKSIVHTGYQPQYYQSTKQITDAEESNVTTSACLTMNNIKQTRSSLMRWKLARNIPTAEVTERPRFMVPGAASMQKYKKSELVPMTYDYIMACIRNE